MKKNQADETSVGEDSNLEPHLNVYKCIIGTIIEAMQKLNTRDGEITGWEKSSARV